MKSCREVTRLLSEAQERPLDLSERASVKLHLMICRGCRNFSSQMDNLRTIARAYVSGKRDAAEGDAEKTDGERDKDAGKSGEERDKGE
ncbi:zf-HC2 domain-containing protein [Microbulbifer sp. 2201CG32-9]|uniref:zf-HC2 domain-containing protein n=1 Tax=Microbulbifer sp. 2201CG32-9 TaxID=3232309 RepID=UPI00345BA1FB